MRRADIQELLPEVMQRTVRPETLLFGLLEVMEGLQEPSESRLDKLDSYFDPRRCRDEFVPFLARWVNLESLLQEDSGPAVSGGRTLSTGLGRLRELIAAASQLSRWRGTAKGLLAFLQTATGTAGFRIDERVQGQDGRLRPFHIRVTAPAATRMHRVLLEKIIELEKPSYVTYELRFEEAEAHAPPDHPDPAGPADAPPAAPAKKPRGQAP